MAVYSRTVAPTDPNLRPYPVPIGHRTAERRSLAMHRLIAQRLDHDGLERARTRVDTWIADGGPVHPTWAAAWQTVLAGPLADVARAIARDDAEMTQLRQSTPFAGALPNGDRLRILREIL